MGLLSAWYWNLSALKDGGARMRFLCHLNKLIIILMPARLKGVILQVNCGEKLMFIIWYRFYLLRYHYWGFILKNCYMLDNIGTIFRFFQATYCDTVLFFACWIFNLLGSCLTIIVCRIIIENIYSFCKVGNILELIIVISFWCFC